LKLYETDRNLGALGLHPGQSIVNDSLVFIERQNKFTNGRIDFIPYTDSQQNFFGFGCLMLFRRETFIEVPAELKIYFGDDWIFHTHVARGYTNYFISNMLHYTPYAATTGTLTNHVSIHDAELVHFEKHMGDFLRGL
jgi:hypothetical protein